MLKKKLRIPLSMPFLSILTLFSLLIGCTVDHHQKGLHSTKEREMSVGIVQKEIRVGMSQTEVAEALGSPNIVTRDKDGKEAWVYDKIASEASYSTSSGGIGSVGGVAGTTLVLGLFGGSYSQQAGSASTTQKTLTVIIKFDQSHLVDTFSYHSSKF